MSLNNSIEVQDIVIVGILRDPLLLDLVRSDIREEFFEDRVTRSIFNSVIQFHSIYGKSPTNKELTAYIQGNPHHDQDLKYDMMSRASYLYNTEQYDDSFIKDTMTQFISNSRMESIITKALEDFTNTKKVDVAKLAEMIVDASDYEIVDSEIMNLGDFDAYQSNKIKYHGSTSNPRVIKSFIPEINYKLTAGGYAPGELIAVVAPPGVGKSNFLVNEVVNCAKQGYNVLSVYIGDMNEVTSSNRLMACLTGIPIRNLYENQETYKSITYNPAYQSILSRIYLTAMPPGEVSVDKLTATIKKLQLKHDIHFDMIVVDYADNLEAESLSSYDSAGTIYNKLKALGTNNLSPVLTASQPKIHHFKDEIIPFEALAESSKKQHVLDVCITFNKPSRDSDVGSLFMAKVREGETGSIIRVGLNNSVSQIRSISEDEYRSARYDIDDANLNKGEGELPDA